MINKLLISDEPKFRILRLILTVALSVSVSAIIFSQQNSQATKGMITEPANTYSQPVKTGTTLSAESIQSSFREIAERVQPVVVQIDITEVQVQQTMPSPFDFFFPGQQGQEREFRSQGLGSGVIVHREGNTYFVLTNQHVAGEADDIQVTLYDGSRLPAELVGGDSRKDIALIAFESSADLAVAELGDSDSARVGDWVLAVGNPYGYFSTVTGGIISAVGRSGPGQNINDFIQTDAAINEGNSGGALVDLDGRVIGINTWIATPTGSSIGLGFAIPINNVKSAIDQFIESGEIEYGWLGVSIANPIDEQREDLLLININGALVIHVFTDSPAARAGILPGDFVTSVNGQPVEDNMELTRLVGDLSAGETVDIDIYRYGEPVSVQVRIAPRADAETISSNSSNLWPGLVPVSQLTDEVRENLEISDNVNGIIVDVTQDTKPDIAGVQTGDIVTEINGQSISSIIDFYRALNDNINKATYTILRGDTQVEYGVRR